MGGHGYHGAIAFGNFELAALYTRAVKEGLVEPIKRKGLFHGMGQFLRIRPVSRLTEKGQEMYKEFKTREDKGELKPNTYTYFLSD